MPQVRLKYVIMTAVSTLAMIQRSYRNCRCGVMGLMVYPDWKCPVSLADLYVTVAIFLIKSIDNQFYLRDAG
jgi:hypothetical protein